MKCGSCGCATREGQRFCEACGAALEKKCRGCGATASAAARYCGSCGASVSVDADVATNAVSPGTVASTAVGLDPRRDPKSNAGERRQLTVLFADVVGATTLSGRLDPEALRELLRAYQQVCVECVGRYGGNIHQYAGDGVLAYFGYPAAHDNDAERAVLAALAIVEGTRRLATDLRQHGQTDIAVRVGIHTGMVVVGEMGAGEMREVHAIGETPNVAARIQGEAAPDSVCVSAATLRLLKTHPHTRSMGVRSLKGVAKDIELFVIEAAGEAGSLGARKQTTPLVGRESELAHLQERWSLARDGHGQAVLISGEGGIGKSRLLAAFRESAGVAEPAWRNIYCSPFYQNSALHPLIDLIERSLGSSGDSPAERYSALRLALDGAGLADDMSLALAASLIGLGTDEKHAAALDALAPDQRKRRTLDLLIAWLHADAQVSPLVVAVEDLHWVDASTRELLGVLLERIADMPIMLALTFRPEFVPAWAMHGRISMLPLARLSSEQSATLALGVIGSVGLPAQIVEQVVQRTDGVPLFVEELTKAMIETQTGMHGDLMLLPSAGASPAAELPATLRDSLTARLDRLGEAKLVAQVASVLGREFDYVALHAICGLPSADLEHRLAALTHAEIIHQRGIPPRSHYVFKHALIQEAAYDTLLKSARASYHQRAATAYVQEFADIAQARPELVAHHYSRALMPAQAVDYWQRAGDLALARSGYSEVMGHLIAALEQLALLPESAERMKTELSLRVKFGNAFFMVRGAAAPEAAENFERAVRITETLGDSPEGFMALWGDWLNKNAAARVLDAARRSDDLVALAERLGNDEYVLQAHHSRWTNFYGIGDARISRADTLVGIRLYDRDKHRHHRHIYAGHDPGVCACGTGANAAWLCGYADEAMELADRAIAIGEEIEHPFSQVIGLMWATLASYGTRNYAAARVRAEALQQLCERLGFPVWRGLAMVVSGACRTLAGETEFGLKLIAEGLVGQRQFGMASWMGTILAASAEAHIQAGNLGHALELLAEAIAHAEKSHAKVLLPEVERLQAQALLFIRQIDVSQAILRIEAAAAHARQQGALMLEWRATMTLARLHAGAGRHEQARRMLGDQYAAFTQGFALPDLVEGKQLLDSLH